MTHSVILSACRTPIGKLCGALSAMSAPELGAVAIRGALQRAGVEVDMVDQVILGNVLSAGVGQAPARQAALKAGLPATVEAVTVNQVCGSGLKAVMLADQAIRAGDAQLIVAGGMESMSRSPYLVARQSAGKDARIDAMMHDGLVCAFSGKSMGEIAERLAREDGITRSDQDRYALESHTRAVRAWEQGLFQREIVPVRIEKGSGPVKVERDEGPRADTSLERLGALRPAFDPMGTVTPGNASMISDGAAAVVVASDGYASAIGRPPLARIVASATVGTPPEQLFLAPVDAVHGVLQRAGLGIEAIDLIEINEAFAVQMLACLRRMALSSERVNVRGGAIALGHPIGASGARILVTLLYALRDRQRRYGLATLCLGGGNAVAMIVERLESATM